MQGSLIMTEYLPAHRRSSLAELCDDIATLAVQRQKQRRLEPIIITLGGPTASGKSRILDHIATYYDSSALCISTDHYYKGKARLQELGTPLYLRENFDHPFAVDLAKLAMHLTTLKNGNSIDMPRYDILVSEPLSETITTMPARFIFVEGIVANHPTITKLSDMTASVYASPETRLARRIARDKTRKQQSAEQITHYFETIAEPTYVAHLRAGDLAAKHIIET